MKILHAAIFRHPSKDLRKSVVDGFIRSNTAVEGWIQENMPRKGGNGWDSNQNMASSFSIHGYKASIAIIEQDDDGDFASWEDRCCINYIFTGYREPYFQFHIQRVDIDYDHDGSETEKVLKRLDPEVKLVQFTSDWVEQYDAEQNRSIKKPEQVKPESLRFALATQGITNRSALDVFELAATMRESKRHKM